MENVLDCSDRRVAMESIASIFGTSVNTLTQVIGSLDTYDNDFVDKDYVYREVADKFGEPRSPFKAIWFHGTRGHDVRSFYSEGLLPKSEVGPRILDRLTSLSEGLENSGDYPNSLSLSAKQADFDEGPFGFLIRDAVVHSLGFAGNFTQCSELVEDLAGTLLGENYEKLVDRYYEESSPYVVAFKGKAGVTELKHAVWYLYLTHHRVDILETGGIEMCCFNGGGCAVPPSEIQSIESLQHV